MVAPLGIEIMGKYAPGGELLLDERVVAVAFTFAAGMALALGFAPMPAAAVPVLFADGGAIFDSTVILQLHFHRFCVCITCQLLDYPG